MKIQNSRNSRQPLKDYSSVCHQQGRMLTDSDLTEQALISRDRLNQALRDVIGSGTPRHGALLQLIEDGDEQIPSLHWGRVYVDGIPGEVRADAAAPDADRFDYQHQLYYPEAPPLPAAAHRLYVDVWERSVIWLEDDMLRDPGLHGADTSTRSQTTAQVKWCDAQTDPLCADVNPPIGDARLRLALRGQASTADPCDPCADELELNDPVGNYLFRVEVHDVAYDADDQPEALVLKWSSENAAEAYATADVPPDFAGNQFVYEFFDRSSESRLGAHLGRDGSNQRIVDGRRQALVGEFSAASPEAKEFVRRWDGWCRIEKNGADWQLTEGFEGSQALPGSNGADKPGHVIQGGAGLGLELRVISLEIELADHPLVAGDYWTTAVRESIHQQGDVLLEDENGGGLPPEGELHHYLLLADVAADGSLSLPTLGQCDPYHACQPFQFPSLSDLRAGDVCYDNESCNMPQVGTVQQALDHLCRERDLRWHNRHLHGWGVVCGLALECDRDNPAGVVLNSGYALDCDGNDMVVEDEVSIDIPMRLTEEGIDPAGLDQDQGVCLYLEYDAEGELDVGIELYEPDNESWIERLRDTLLFDFYEDCILELIEAVTGELRDTDVQARCALTRCGQEQIRPVQRRTLTLANLMFHHQQGETDTVLNISHCEHALLQDLYNKLRDHLRSKTFCAQFQNRDFPPYPFEPAQPCRATWFTPQPMDHIRLHPDGKLAFAWRRSSDRVFVFENLKGGCLGDLVGYFDLPPLDGGSITDLTVDRNNLIHVAAIVHQEDTLLARGELPAIDHEGCMIEIEWQTSFICGVKIVALRQSPWSNTQLYALGLCKGAYLLDPEALFKEDKVEREPDWAFPASGHMEFDLTGNRLVCTAAAGKADCSDGEYDRLVAFGAVPDAAVKSQPVLTLTPTINNEPVRGSDGLAVSQSAGTVEPAAAGDSAGGFVTTATGRGLVVFLVFDSGERRSLGRFDIAGLAKGAEGQTWPGRFHHDFGISGRIALQYAAGGKLDGVVATRFGQHDLQYIPGDPRQYEKGLLNSIPVQAGPVDIRVHDEMQQLLVLNHLGQSITVLNYELKVYQQQRDPLQKYRADVIAAFWGLLSNLLQYLKDCFCNHLLIQCPECDEDDKVYLGCLSLRDGVVYNLCNFTRRKYVKTFPTMAYWLSLIPIGPLVSWAVEQLCCLVLPNLFQQRESGTVAISARQLGTVSAVMNTDHGNLMQAVSVAGKDLGAKSMNALVRAGYKDNGSFDDLTGAEYRYRPGVEPKLQSAFTSNRDIMAKVDGIEAERARTRDEVAALRNEVSGLKQEKATQKQAADSEVTALRAEIDVLKEQKSATDAKIAQLENTRAEFDALRTSVQPLINGAKPVSSIQGMTEANRRILEDNNITTVRQLADADPAVLRRLGIASRTATILVTKANDQVKML